MALVPMSKFIKNVKSGSMTLLCLMATTSMVLAGCADSVGPASRNANVPAPRAADERKKGLNETGEPIIYLPLGHDVLLPQVDKGDPLPDTVVGPFELRGETLAGALQLILDGTNIPVAFESEASLTQPVTVTNMKGPISMVVSEVCSLANMYCSFQNGVLVVKDEQVFTVTIPPIAAKNDVAALLTNIAGAIGNITGKTPITDPSTRTIVYRASQRTADVANRYFQRLRSNTSMIVYETYIWEVSLDSGNSTGIKWDGLAHVGRYAYGLNIQSGADQTVGTPISIGLPTMGSVNFDTGDVLQFISSYGAVKTISQPQITILSGSSAKLRIADTQNYVASISRTTTDGGNTTVSTTTDSVDTGFTLNISSNWDNSTVYGSIDILLQEVKAIDTFDDNPDAVVQLPQTSERELQTQVRVRPGDLLLIAGLVKENDGLTKEGIGLAGPNIPTGRSAKTSNTELVFLLRPRVVVFTSADENTPRKGAVALPKASFTQPADVSTGALSGDMKDDVMPPVTAVPAAVSQPLVSEQPVVVKPAVAPALPSVAPVTAPVPTPAPVAAPVAMKKEMKADEPASTSIEIQPLSSVAPVEKTNVVKSSPAPAPAKVAATADPSVIVDYNVLGR